MGGLGGLVDRGDQRTAWRRPEDLAGPSYRGSCEVLDLPECRIAVRRRGADASLFEGSRFVVAIHGFVANWGEPPLAHLTVGLAGGSDAERLTALLEIRGPAGLRLLRGEFAVVLLDRRQSAVYLCRDLAGARPLAYRRRGRALYFASEIRSLLDAGEADAQLESSYLDAWAENAPTADRSPFSSVRRVYPGVVWRVDLTDTERTLQPAIQWSPPPVRSDWTEAEAAQSLSALLERAVLRRLDAVRRTAVSLSGGLDSGSIWCLAANHVPAESGRLLAVSVRYPGFSCDEGATLAIHQSASRHEFGEVDGREVTSTKGFAKTLSAVDLPVVPSVVYLQQVIEEAARRGASVVLTGLGGDQWLGGTIDFLKDLVAKGRVRDFLRWASRLRSRGQLASGRAARLIMKGVVQSVVRRSPEWLPPKDAEAGHASGAGLAARRLEVERSGWYLEPAEQLAERARMELRHPFMDEDLIGLVFSLPEELLWAGSEWKGLLREAIADVPGSHFRHGSLKVPLDVALSSALCEPSPGEPGAALAGGLLWRASSRRFCATNAFRTTGPGDTSCGNLLDVPPRPEASVAVCARR